MVHTENTTSPRRAAVSSSLLATLCGAAVVVAGLLAAPAHGGTVTTWTGGGGNGSWSVGGNWSTAVDTTSNFDLIFGGTTQVVTVNDVGTVKVDSIQFVNTGTAFTLSGTGGSTMALSAATITTAAGAVTGQGDLISMNMTVSGSNTITLGAGHNMSLTGNIGDGVTPGSITYGGGAQVFVVGTNSYSGGTFITGGQVWTSSQAGAVNGANNAFGTGLVTVSGSGAALIRNNSTIANNFAISGAGSGSGAGAGAIRGSFGQANETATLTGTVTLTSNASIFAASNVDSDITSRLLFTGTAGGFVDLGGNTLTLVPQGAATSRRMTIEFAGLVTGAGSVVVNGGSNIGASGVLAGQTVRGVVLMSGSNDYAGGTTVASGILRVANARAIGSGPLAVNAYGLDLNNMTLQAGVLSGSAAGVIFSDAAGASTLVTTGNANSTYAGTIINGTAGGTVGLNKSGSGVLTLTGSNTYTGVTGVDGGVISLGSLLAIGTSGPITFGGGTLRYSTVNQVDYSARFANSLRAISIDTNGQTVTYASPIASTNVGGLTKSGAGTLYLNAANQFTGTTTVSAGTLAGTGSVLGPLSVQPGAVFDPGSGPGSTTVFGVGSFAQATGGTTKMQVTGTTAGSLYDQVLFSGPTKAVTWGGTLDLTVSGSYANYTAFNLFSGFDTQSGNLGAITLAAGSPYDTLSFSGPNGGVWTTGNTAGGQSMIFNQNTGVLMVVPEPGAMTLAGLGFGACGLWLCGRRRRRTTMT